MSGLKTKYYIVKQGKATPIKADKITLDLGRMPPTGSEVLELGNERIVLYPENSVNPFPLASPHEIKPGDFGPHDLENFLGPYMASLIRRAMKFAEDKWTLPMIITIITAGVGTLVSITTLIIVVKVFRDLGFL